MASILDLIRSASGQPDINQQIATALGQAPGQPGSPQGPQPGAGAPAAPPAAGAPPAGPQGPQQAPQQPEAYQSQPDMAQLYFKFAQQQHADDMFNRGIAGIAAGFAPSWDRNAILGMGRDTTQDPGALFGNLMKLQQYHQQQQRLFATQQAVPGLVASYKADPALIPILQNNPDMVPAFVDQHQPTGEYRNWLIAHDTYVKQNSDPNDPQSAAKADAQFRALVPMENSLIPGGGDPGLTQLHLRHMDYLRTHNNQEPPDNRFESPATMGAHDKQVGDLTNAQSVNSASLGDLEQGLTKIGGGATAIAQNPKLTSLLTKAQNIPGLLTLARKSGWASQNIPAPAQWKLDQDEVDLLHKIDDLTLYKTGSLSAANPHLQGRLGTIDSALGTLQQFDSGPENWKNNLHALVDAVDSTRANAAGASGQLQRVLDMNDSNMEMKVDPSYLPGGRNYLGEPKQMSVQDLADARKAMVQWEKEYPGEGRMRYVRHLMLQGYAPPAAL